MSEASIYKDLLSVSINGYHQVIYLRGVFKDMTRALNRDDIQKKIKKEKNKENQNFFAGLSETWVRLERSQDFLNNMVYSHSWTLFDNCLDDIFEKWLIAEPDKIDPTIKLTAKELIGIQTIENIRIKLAEEELANYSRSGVIAKLKKAEEKFKFKAFINEQEENWFKEAREIRNSIVHGKKINSSLLKPKLLNPEEKALSHKVIIRCMYRQEFIIARIWREVKKRETKLESLKINNEATKITGK